MNKQLFLQQASGFAQRGYSQATARNSDLKLVLKALLEQRWLEHAGSRKPSEAFLPMSNFENFDVLGAFVSAAIVTQGSLAETHGAAADDDSPVRPFYPQAPYGLEEFLEQICPGITFLQFRAIERCYLRKAHWVSEFYEGPMFYASQVLPFTSLWDVLVERGLIEVEGTP
jgi:hypothetical protein